MEKFNKIINEATIKGNPGIPGEGKDLDKDDIRYLQIRKDDEYRRLNITPMDSPGNIGPRMMSLVYKSQGITRGHERELEKLAREVLRRHFKDILHNVGLDIKLVRSGNEVNNFIQDNMRGDGDTQFNLPKLRKITDPDLIDRIHKAKLANNIIQGEAKNTKYMMHLDFVRDGIIRIFGNRVGEDLFNTWIELSNMADKMDWLIPVQTKARMMEEHPGGMAGAVSVDWVEDDEIEDDDALFDNDDPVPSTDFSEVPTNDNEDEEDGDKHRNVHHPVIRSRGVDFPMLLHETVKGLYELIASVSLPGDDASEEELRKSKTIRQSTSSYEDEAEDFRTGPHIALDFRRFVYENPYATKYVENMPAFVFGYMMDESNLTPNEFLKLFRGMLNETKEARDHIDRIIREINQGFADYFTSLSNIDDDYTVDLDVDYTDYSSMSNKDLVESIKKSSSREQSKIIKKLTKSKRDELVDYCLQYNHDDVLDVISPYLK